MLNHEKIIHQQFVYNFYEVVVYELFMVMILYKLYTTKLKLHTNFTLYIYKFNYFFIKFSKTLELTSFKFYNRNCLLCLVIKFDL